MINIYRIFFLLFLLQQQLFCALNAPLNKSRRLPLGPFYNYITNNSFCTQTPSVLFKKVSLIDAFEKDLFGKISPKEKCALKDLIDMYNISKKKTIFSAYKYLHGIIEADEQAFLMSGNNLEENNSHKNMFKDDFDHNENIRNKLMSSLLNMENILKKYEKYVMLHDLSNFIETMKKMAEKQRVLAENELKQLN